MVSFFCRCLPYPTSRNPSSDSRRLRVQGFRLRYDARSWRFRREISAGYWLWKARRRSAGRGIRSIPLCPARYCSVRRRAMRSTPGCCRYSHSASGAAISSSSVFSVASRYGASRYTNSPSVTNPSTTQRPHSA